MANTQVNIKHETQVFLPQNEDNDIDEIHHQSHSKQPKIKSKAASPKKGEFTGLPVDEVNRQSKESRWKSLRTVLLALILLILIGCIIGVILMIIFYPKCPHKPNLDWWQRETTYQIEVSNFKDTNGDGVGDLNGVLSEIDYLDKLGVKTIILTRGISKDTPQQFDSEYAADIKVVDSLKNKLKEKEMHLIIDMPANFLEKNDQETIEYWLNNYADGLRITNLKELSTDESVQNGFVSKWQKLAENISKKTLSTKLITVYPNDKSSIKYEKLFLKLDPDQLSDNAKFISSIEEMYNSLEKSQWPVLVLGDYNSGRIKNTFGDNKLSRLAHGLIMLLRGTPLTLFGDEIELTGASEYENTMQWNNLEGCGFTNHNSIGPFFRGATGNCANNVEDVSTSSSGLIVLYSNLASLRKEPSVQWGDVKIASKQNENVISFVREANGFDSFLVAANTADQTVSVNFKEKHSLADTAVVSLVYSINSDDKFEYKVDDDIKTDNVQLRSGQLLVLKIKKH